MILLGIDSEGLSRIKRKHSMTKKHLRVQIRKLVRGFYYAPHSFLSSVWTPFYLRLS